jgi:hypothetical protein
MPSGVNSFLGIAFAPAKEKPETGASCMGLKERREG